MIPFRVVLRTRAPLILGAEPLHLDAVLMYVAALRARGPEALDYEPATATGPDPALPLARAEGGGTWVYRASAARLVPPLDWGSHAFISKIGGAYPDLHHVGPAIKSGTGPLRQYVTHMTTVHPHAVVFYGVGDPDGVRDLLGDLTHLGKKRSVGFGEIDGRAPVRVEPIDDDRTLVWLGSAMRVLPVALVESLDTTVLDCAVRSVTYRPPYRDRRAQAAVSCFVPGAPAKTCLEEEAGLEWLRAAGTEQGNVTALTGGPEEDDS